jgi:hypothetical protein
MSQRPHVPFALVAFAVLACFVPCSAALAQGCHGPLGSGAEAGELAEGRAAGFRVAVGVSAATYATARYAGEYQGLHPSLALRTRYVEGEASAPVYRIVRNGLRGTGMGDLGLGLAAPLLRDANSQLEAGPLFAMTVPTGDPEKQLGMGHTMLMPGAFGRVRYRGVSAQASLQYGRAVGAASGGHAHHSGPAPLVNPMNRAEVEHALALAYAPLELLRIVASLYGATPVADATGSAREVLGMGVLLLWWQLAGRVEVQLPLVGDPFSHKTLIQLAIRF